MIRTKLEDVYRLYRKETDPKVKERLLLVLRIKSDGEILAMFKGYRRVGRSGSLL
jgi:hypothetical protein